MVNEVLKLLEDLTKIHPVYGAGIALWVASIGTYALRNTPTNIMIFLKRFFTTKVTLMNSADSFYQFLKWYQDQGYSKTSRFLKITNGKWGNEGMTSTSVGYGTSIIWIKKKPVLINLTSKEQVGTNSEVDQLTITTLGRSHKTIDHIIKSISVESDTTSIWKWNDHWKRIPEQLPRSLGSIMFNNGVQEQLLSVLDDFTKKEQWYLDNGIPYQLGILLYGPPGTGKTSIIKGLSSYLNYRIYSLKPSSLNHLEEALLDLKPRSILAIEDIDTESAVTRRNKNREPDVREEYSNKNDDKSLSDMLSLTNLSDVLNGFDGINQHHGRILVITTNHIEKLDPALIRPGRIDLKLEIGFADEHCLRSFFSKFFSDYILPREFKIKEGLSSADIQQLILTHGDPKTIYEKCIVDEVQSNPLIYLDEKKEFRGRKYT